MRLPVESAFSASPKSAKFPEGKEMSAEDMAEYLAKGGNPEAGKEWKENHEEHKDVVKDKNKEAFQRLLPVERKVAYGPGKKITVEELEEIGGNMLEGDEDLEALARQLNSAGGARRVEKAMRDADKILGTHGVEAVFEEGDYDGDPAMTYLNTGDTYAMTLVYDVGEDELYVSTWGDWVEWAEGKGRQMRASVKKTACGANCACGGSCTNKCQTKTQEPGTMVWASELEAEKLEAEAQAAEAQAEADRQKAEAAQLREASELLPFETRGAKQAASLEEGSEEYFGQMVRPLITKAMMTRALKPHGFAPRGKGSFDRKRNQVSLLIDPLEGRGMPIQIWLNGSHYTANDGMWDIFARSSHGTLDHRGEFTGDPKRDAKAILEGLADLMADQAYYDKEWGNKGASTLLPVERMKLGEKYPWDECIADQMERYGDKETAEKVCGAIRAKSQFGKGAAHKVAGAFDNMIGDVDTVLQALDRCEDVLTSEAGYEDDADHLYDAAELIGKAIKRLSRGGRRAKQELPEELKEHQFTSEDNPNPKGNDRDGDGKTNEPSPIKEASVPSTVSGWLAWKDDTRTAASKKERAEKAKAQWMADYEKLSGVGGIKPHDFWDTASYLFSQGMSAKDAAKQYKRRKAFVRLPVERQA